MKKLPWITIVSLVLFLAIPLAAEAGWSWPDLGTIKIIPEACSEGEGEGCQNLDVFVQLFINFSQFMLGAIASFTLLIFVWNSFGLVTSAGSPEKVQAAKAGMTGAVFGLIIVMASWAVVNSVVCLLIRDDGQDCTIFGQSWWDYGEEAAADCNNLPALAAANGVPYPHQNAPVLDELLNCLRNNISPSDIIDEDNLWTYDNDHDTCNYTRGKKLCETTCSHSENSCHYGGTDGHEGALAVDLNAKPPYSDTQLAQALKTLIEPGGVCHGLMGECFIETSPSHIHLAAGGCGNEICDHLSNL